MIDYKKLLEDYMAGVMAAEGVSFIDNCSTEDEECINELHRIKDYIKKLNAP